MLNGHSIAVGGATVIAAIFTVGLLVAVAALCVEKVKERRSNLVALIVILAAMSFIWWSAALYH